MGAQRQLIIAIMVAIISVGGAAAALYQIQRKESSFETYRNTQFSFEIKYPEGWRRGTPKEENIIVELTSPKEEISFHVGAYEAKEVITLEHLKELNSEVLLTREDNGPPVSVESTDIELAGLPAFRVLTKDKTGSVNMVITALAGQIIYVLQYKYYPDTPKKLIKATEKIVSSFALAQDN